MKRSALRSLPLTAALPCALLLWGSPAQANLLELYLDGYGGGLYGTPTIAGYTTPGGEDFYVNQTGGLVGARAGIELLYTDLYLQFDQFLNRQGAAGSSLQLMLGWDGSLLGKPDHGWALLLGGYGGMIFGFPYTPRVPIDKDQIATLGVAVEGQVGTEYRFNRFLRFQAVGTVGYHYLFGGAKEVTIDNAGNVAATTTHGFHLQAKVGLRFRAGLL